MTSNIQPGNPSAMIQPVDDQIIEQLESLQSRCFDIQKLDPGARKFFQTAEVMNQLQAIFNNPNVLKCFMLLQGSPVGFMTDREYPPHVVRDALVQAFLVGVFPINNQMNIIGGKMYIPKEGFEYLLHNSPHGDIQNLEYFRFDHMEFIQFHQEIKAATIKATLVWKLKGGQEQAFTRNVQVIYHGVEKKNNIDMAFGKAEAKMLQWLYKRLTNITIPHGDATDLSPAGDDIPTTATVEKPASQEQLERIKELLEQVHPDAKAQMIKKLDTQDWQLTEVEAGRIIRPLILKAKKYQEGLQNAIPGLDIPSLEKPVNNTHSRGLLEKQMHVLGKQIYGDGWTEARKELVKQINPDKSSSKDLDIGELKDIVDLLSESAQTDS